MSILRLCPFFAALLGIVIGLKNWSHLNLAFKLLWLHVTVSGVVEMAAYLMAVSGMNNMWLLHIYTPIEFTLLTLVFYMFLKGWSLRWLLLAAIPTFITLSAIVSFSIQSLDMFNTFSRGTGAIFLIVFAVCYLLKHLRAPDFNMTVHVSELLFVSGALLYFSMCLLAFFTINFLVDSAGHRLVNYIWIGHLMVCSLYYLIYATSLWRTRRA